MQSTNDEVIMPKLDDVLQPDETDTLRRAIIGAKALGFAKVTFEFDIRNGFVNKVGASFFEMNKDKKENNSEKHT